MSVNKKYYWLKLKNDFFNQKIIKKLRKIAGGDTYTIIYLKMQLASIQNNGRLVFEGVESTFAEELALELDEDLENVNVTLAYLQTNKLIEIVEDDEYLLTAVPDVIGSESAAAERMRNSRKRAKNKIEKCNNVTPVLQGCYTDVTNCYTEKEKDIELDIEKSKDNKIKENNTDVSCCQDNFIKNYLKNINPFSSHIEIEKLTSWEEDIDPKLINKAIEIAVVNNARRYSYINAILNNWLKDNIKTLEQYESLEKIKQKEKELQNGFGIGQGIKYSKTNGKSSTNNKPTAEDFREFIKKR